MLFDADGNQTAATTLNTIMTAAPPLSDRGSGGDWTIADVAARTQAWLQANGAPGATVGLDGGGHLAVELNSTSVNLAFRDQTATPPAAPRGCRHRLRRDATAPSTRRSKAFSNFFGLNDFIVDNAGAEQPRIQRDQCRLQVPVTTTLRFVRHLDTAAGGPWYDGHHSGRLHAGTDRRHHQCRGPRHNRLGGPRRLGISPAHRP
jgi:hypothetical protein